MANSNATLSQESFTFTVPTGKKATFFFTVQSSAEETVTFYKDGSPTPYVSKSRSGVDFRKRRGYLEAGEYKCEVTSSLGNKMKILHNQWDLNIGSAQKQSVIVAGW